MGAADLTGKDGGKKTNTEQRMGTGMRRVDQFIPSHRSRPAERCLPCAAAVDLIAWTGEREPPRRQERQVTRQEIGGMGLAGRERAQGEEERRSLKAPT